MEKSVKRRGPGRPKTNIKWKPASTRFLPDEKRRLDKVAKDLKVSKDRIMREGTMNLVKKAETEKKLELTLGEN